MKRIWALCLGLCACSIFSPQERELSECFPDCSLDQGTEDSGVQVDDLGFDAGLDLGATVDLGFDAGVDIDLGPEDFGVEPVEPLDVLYRTPHGLTIGWTAVQPDLDVQGWVLQYALDRESLLLGIAELWDVDDDANLGFEISPHGPGMVERTTIMGLQPQTEYHVRVFARVPAGAPVLVAEGAGETIEEPGDSVVLFREELRMGAVRDGFNSPEDSMRAFDGTRALWFGTMPAPAEAELRGLEIEFPNMPQARFERAYLEFFVLLDFENTIAPAPYIVTDLGDYSHGYSSLSVQGPNRGWHRVQIPIVAFENQGASPPNAAALRPFVGRFSVRGVWPASSGVYFDEITIRF